MSNFQGSFEEFRTNIYERLHSSMERKDEIEKRFAVRGTAKEILDPHVLREFFVKLAASEYLENPVFTIDGEQFAEIVKQKDLYDFLAVLISAGCAVSDARAFTLSLVQPSNGPNSEIPPKSLPVDIDYLNKVFANRPIIVDNFFSKQACFSPFVIEAGKDNVVEISRVRRAPWLEEDKIGTGSFGKVFKVKIAKGHFVGYRGPEPAVVARKDFLLEAEARKNFKKEADVMRQILLQKKDHPNVLQSLGTLEIRENPPIFSIFMPLAEDDLQCYMKKNKEGFESDTSARGRLIRSAAGLADGLNFIHRRLSMRDEIGLTCYHMDLKPNNVLVFRDDRPQRSNPHEEDRLWKLSDFGMSKVRNSPKRDESDPFVSEFDFRKLFRRQSPEVDSSSGTYSPRHGSTYAPVESANGEKVNEKGDVWSLACIISVLFTFMEEGIDGMESYSQRRLKENKSEIKHCGDYFYTFNRHFRRYEANPAVKKHHNNLVAKAGKRSPKEKKAVKDMLNFLEKGAFQIQSSKRCNACTLSDRLTKTWERYIEISSENSRTEVKAVDQESGHTSNGNSRYDSFKSTETDQVLQWHLGVEPQPLTTFKGCESSPDGTVIAYWSDTLIMTFQTEGKGSSRKTNVLNKAGNRRSDNTYSWKCVKLTNRYLIAAITAGYFKCHIFDIESDQKLSKFNEVSFQQKPEIHTFAISMDQQSMICVLGNSSEAAENAQLFSARFMPTSPKERGTEIDTLGSDLSILSGTDSTDEEVQLVGGNQYSLGKNASTVLKLLPRTQTEGYIAFGSRDGSAVVDIAQYTMDQRLRLVVQSIDGRSLDNTHARQFTDLACLYKDSAVAAVIRSERIYKIKFPSRGRGNGSVNEKPVEKELSRHRILKVKAQRESDTIYALGKQISRRKMHLLRLNLSGGHDRLDVVEVTELPNLADSGIINLEICKDDKGGFALVTSIVPPHNYIVHSIRLQEN